MLRMTLAVAAGFLTIMILVTATQVALMRYLFHTTPGVDADLLPPVYFVGYGVVQLVYAVMGGCVCAAIGKKYEAPTILGALMLGTAIGHLIMNRSGEPTWYAVVVSFAVAIVTTVSGYRWLGRIGEAGERQARPRN
jgi:hypothetical protein